METTPPVQEHPPSPRRVEWGLQVLPIDDIANHRGVTGMDEYLGGGKKPIPVFLPQVRHTEEITAGGFREDVNQWQASVNACIEGHMRMARGMKRDFLGLGEEIGTIPEVTYMSDGAARERRLIQKIEALAEVGVTLHEASGEVQEADKVRVVVNNGDQERQQIITSLDTVILQEICRRPDLLSAAIGAQLILPNTFANDSPIFEKFFKEALTKEDSDSLYLLRYCAKNALLSKAQSDALFNRVWSLYESREQSLNGSVQGSNIDDLSRKRHMAQEEYVLLECLKMGRVPDDKKADVKQALIKASKDHFILYEKCLEAKVITMRDVPNPDFARLIKTYGNPELADPTFAGLEEELGFDPTIEAEFRTMENSKVVDLIKEEIVKERFDSTSVKSIYERLVKLIESGKLDPEIVKLGETLVPFLNYSVLSANPAEDGPIFQKIFFYRLVSPESPYNLIECAGPLTAYAKARDTYCNKQGIVEDSEATALGMGLYGQDEVKDLYTRVLEGINKQYSTPEVLKILANCGYLTEVLAAAVSGDEPNAFPPRFMEFVPNLLGSALKHRGGSNKQPALGLPYNYDRIRVEKKSSK